MSTIYQAGRQSLKQLLASAGKSGDATLLIPNLQRPYVWGPKQVISLVDSLIRGWPFGTLLTWGVKPDGKEMPLARSFWKVADRRNGDHGDLISAKHPPSPFEMLLDGQQRVQSLLLALGGDGWGFKLLDRDWYEPLGRPKPRGRGNAKWSLGCLCVDTRALANAYSDKKRITAVNYEYVLRWVVTDDAVGSNTSPVEKASSHPGRFVRLSRLWDEAPEQSGMDPFEAEGLARKILVEHGVSEKDQAVQSRSVAALLMALTQVKQTEVTSLKLAEYDERAHGTRDVYNDAIVNIFTRLNAAGRTLTRADITFAWLTTDWKGACTSNRDAKSCIADLVHSLKDLKLPVSPDDVVSAVSFIWAVSFNKGQLLTNNDLVNGDKIRPMAGQVSEHWELIVEAATEVSEHIRGREWEFGTHYQSINGLVILWAWYFAALRWRQEHRLAELKKDSLRKSLVEILSAFVDRWLICSQWARIWAEGQNLGSYASRLADCVQKMENLGDVSDVAGLLKSHIESEVSALDQRAVVGLNEIYADQRHQVRRYYTSLWLWNRLDNVRWKTAQKPLQQSGGRESIEVDHIVACDLWQQKLKKRNDDAIAADSAAGSVAADDLAGRVNEIGNCMLLKKNFNISKGKRPLKNFLEGIHEFHNGGLKLEEWATAMGLEMPQVDSDATTVDTLLELFDERSRRIRADLEQFIRGTRARVDL